MLSSDTDISQFFACFFVDFTFATKDNNTEWAAICFSNFFFDLRLSDS